MVPKFASFITLRHAVDNGTVETDIGALALEGDGGDAKGVIALHGLFVVADDILNGTLIGECLFDNIFAQTGFSRT